MIPADSPRTENGGDPRLGQVLDDYLAAIQAGTPLSRDELLASHPELADDLQMCLDSLEFIGQAVASGRAASQLDAPAAVTGEALGDFLIVREIGRGGMGVVYEARQRSLDRRVALKVLPFAAILQPNQLARFQHEIRTAAQLNHPNVVSVYGCGAERGVHYFAMQYIEGESMAHVIARVRRKSSSVKGPGSAGSDQETRGDVQALMSTVQTDRGNVDVRRVAQLGRDAALALQYVHELGVIHRDVKPSNLLLDTQGHLWLTDFGLARFSGDVELTLSGDLVGTLRYMSPEQAHGTSFVLDHRTDIYSLGVTLYELLTLRPAFPAEDRRVLLLDILHTEPIPPRKIDAAIPADLQTIVLKAMSKEPKDRYTTALDLAHDLDRFLQQRPISARPLGRIAHTYRWCKRSPAFAGLVAAVFFMLMCVTAGAIVFARRETAHRQEADARATEAQWQHYLSDMHSAMAAWEQSNVGRALELLERHRPRPGEPDLGGFEWNYLWRQCHDERLKLTINETSYVRGLAFSHDDLLLASGNGEGQVHVWNAADGRLIHEFAEHGDRPVRHVAFSPDDHSLASADNAGTIYLRDVADARRLRTFKGHGGQVLGLLYSSDGTQLVSGCEDSTIRVWDVGTESALQTIHLPSPDLARVTPPWIDNSVWDFGVDGVMRLFDTSNTQEVRSFLRPELAHVKSVVSITSDGRMAATAGLDGVIRLVDLKTGLDIGALGAHGTAIRAIAIAPNNQTLASSDAQGKVVIWNLAQRNQIAVLRGHSGSINFLAFSSDGRRLCTACGDDKLRIWDVTPQTKMVDVCRGHRTIALCVAFSPDGRTMASGGAEPGGGVVILWDVPSGQLVHKFTGHTDWVWSVAFAPDGKELASTGVDGTVRLWDLTSRMLRTTIDMSAVHRKSWVSFSTDGRELITSEDGGTLRIWDRTTGHAMRTVQISQSQPWKPALSPDGRLIVAGADKSIALLDYPSLNAIRRFPQSPLYGDNFAISPDGRMIASCHAQHVHLFSREGISLGTLKHAAKVNSVDFSPDGQSLVSGDNNHEVHIWDVERCQERVALHGHFSWVVSVRFSPDGKTIASASDDGTVRLWRSGPPECAVAAQADLGPHL